MLKQKRKNVANAKCDTICKKVLKYTMEKNKIIAARIVLNKLFGAS